MPTPCPACQTPNADAATACSHCAAVLPQLSLLERAAARQAPAPAPTPAPAPAPTPVPVQPPAPVPPPPAAAPKAIPVRPVSLQPRPAPRRSRTPWVLAIVMLVALLSILGYEHIQTQGAATPIAPTAPATP